MVTTELWAMRKAAEDSIIVRDDFTNAPSIKLITEKSGPQNNYYKQA